MKTCTKSFNPLKATPIRPSAHLPINCGAYGYLPQVPVYVRYIILGTIAIKPVAVHLHLWPQAPGLLSGAVLPTPTPPPSSRTGQLRVPVFVYICMQTAENTATEHRNK